MIEEPFGAIRPAQCASLIAPYAFVAALVAIGFAFAPRPADAHDDHGVAPAKASYTRSTANYRTPDVKMVDANGRAVPLRSLLEGGGPVMLNFVFTSCSAICSVMSGTFAQVQERLGPERDRVRLVSISIDPEHDTPAALKDYAKHYGAGPQWTMLTGSIENSLAAQRAFGVWRGDKMNHDPVTLLRAGPGQPWLRLDGLASAADLLREYRQLAAVKR